MSLIDDKALLVLHDMTGGPNNMAAAPTPAPGGLLPIIIGILTGLFQSMGLCGLTPAAAHRRATRAGPLEQRALRRTIRQSDAPVPLWEPLQSSITNVGRSLTLEETAGLLAEANPSP